MKVFLIPAGAVLVFTPAHLQKPAENVDYFQSGALSLDHASSKDDLPPISKDLSVFFAT